MRKLTHDEQVAAIAKVNPDVEILGEIISSTTKVLCLCRVCGNKWLTIPYSLKSGHGCPECGKVKASNKNRLPHNEHVAAIKKVNPNIEILEEITNVDKKVLCHCLVCNHEWMATPGKLKSGRGCPECKKRKIGDALRLTHDEQVAAINKVNPNVEILGEIINARTKVLTRCKICGHEWPAKPAGLKDGHGCPKCAGKMKLSHTEQVEAIKDANPSIEVLGEITRNDKKVLCHCLVCGHKWDALPHSLKAGRGCPRCATTGFLTHDVGKLYIMVDDLEAPTMIKIGVSVKEEVRRRDILNSAHKAGVFIPALYVAKTWEGPTELMQRIEQIMHENYAEWNIKFPAKFNGYTEFFYYTPETAGVFDAVNEIYYTVVNQF